MLVWVMDRMSIHAVSLLTLCCVASPAFACGVGGGIGPGGMCTWSGAASQPSSAAASEPASPPDDLRWRVSAGYGYSHTIIDFGGHPDIDISRHLALASAEYRVSPRVSLSLTLGAVLAGDTGLHSVGVIKPGIVGAFAASWRVLDQRGYRPFIVLTATVAATSTPIQTALAENQFTALDFRAGIIVGETFWRVFTPYAVGRLFGGPVFYRFGEQNVLGNDRYHFQLGAGAVVALGRRVDLFFEGIPLGEQALSGGVGVHL